MNGSEPWWPDRQKVARTQQAAPRWDSGRPAPPPYVPQRSAAVAHRGGTMSVAGRGEVTGRGETVSLIRPFIFTGGRTRSVHDGLRLDTMIQTLPAALDAPLQFERHRIVELCQEPLSLAEIAAMVGIPLGVARVLVGDLVSSGLVSYQESSELPIPMLERILEGVRAL